ncbi:MAG: glutathione S-transferase family protein [Alphaproteobacteria bacterium]|nr:glutathione S-transferase family protein [Alphaproteobacteria bacterium]
MPKLTFFFGPGACSLVPHITLEEGGIPFEPKPVALRKGQQRTPEYTALNPKGKVPMLLVDGRPLTENVAIAYYLAKTFPEAKLLPLGDTEAEAHALSLLAWCASGVHPRMSPFFGPQRFCDLPDSADSVKKLAGEDTAKNFPLIEKQLTGKQWALGDQWSIIDAYFFVFWRWANFLKIDVSAYPNYAKHAERMAERPAVKRALAREAEATAAFEKAA